MKDKIKESGEYIDPYYKDRFTALGKIPILKNECYYCEDKLNDANRTKDHFYPKSLGGKFTVPCCKSCNKLKADRLPIQWYGLIERMDLAKEIKERRLHKIKILIRAIGH